MTTAKTAGLTSFVVGVLMIVVGAFGWGITSTSLAAERISVAASSPEFLGDTVTGPLAAYYQAEAVKDQALEISQGLSSTELESRARAAAAEGNAEAEAQYEQALSAVTSANAVRSSLHASMLSYGLSVLVMGAGLLFSLLGWALFRFVREYQEATEEV